MSFFQLLMCQKAKTCEYQSALRNRTTLPKMCIMSVYPYGTYQIGKTHIKIYMKKQDDIIKNVCFKCFSFCYIAKPKNACKPLCLG